MIDTKIIKTGIEGELFILHDVDHKKMWSYFVWGQTKDGTKYIGNKTFSDAESACQSAEEHLNTELSDDWWLESI